MPKIDPVLFSGNSHATINRDPNVQRGELGVLDLKLSAPDGDSREFIATGLHPRAEQLFSGAWSACYISAFEIAAKMKKVTLPSTIPWTFRSALGRSVPGIASAPSSPSARRIWQPTLDRKSTRLNSSH